MKQSLRIAVADDEPRMRSWFQEMLPRLGHQVASVAQNGRELVEQSRASRPDLIITDIKMPDMDGIDAATAISRDGPLPVILVSAYHDSDLIDRAEADHILAYLIKPIKREHLETAIAIAMVRFKQFQTLQAEAKTLSQALKDRKHIERAKGLLMRRATLDEEQAFLRMQKLARDKNIKMVDVAEIIIAAENKVEPVARKPRQKKPEA